MINQAIGTVFSIKIPHCPGPSLSDLAIIIYPETPQPAPHEFLHFQKSAPLSVPYPVNVIPWSRSVPHFPLKTPDL